MKAKNMFSNNAIMQVVNQIKHVLQYFFFFFLRKLQYRSCIKPKISSNQKTVKIQIVFINVLIVLSHTFLPSYSALMLIWEVGSLNRPSAPIRNLAPTDKSPMLLGFSTCYFVSNVTTIWNCELQCRHILLHYSNSLAVRLSPVAMVPNVPISNSRISFLASFGTVVSFSDPCFLFFIPTNSFNGKKFTLSCTNTQGSSDPIAPS